MTDDTDTNPSKQSLASQENNSNSRNLEPRLRIPTKADASAIHQLIQQCPPLDLNSVYAYLLLTEHFAQTCVLAEMDGQPAGFVSAYIPPQQTDTLFIWQVAVHQRARGKSLGHKMLSSLLTRPAMAGTRYLETTVGPDNAASRAMFGRLAQSLHAVQVESAFFGSELFGDRAHEEERLIRIGPFNL